MYGLYVYICNTITVCLQQIHNTLYNKKVMAKPIKETPYLKGKDARAFMVNFSSPTKRDSIDDKTRQRMRENFEKINSLAAKQ